jgi:hypothetical protein
MKSSKKIPTESLLKSKALSGYQVDFAKAILTKPEYTVEEAIAALDKVLKKGDK